MRRKGFVDIQVNGYLGVDFSSPDLQIEDIDRITRALLLEGTIGYCATLITSEMAVYERNLPLLARAMAQPGIGDRLLGIHLEGPYLSAEEGARGAHRAGLMRRPDISEFERFQEWAEGKISILTLAPELDGSLALTKHIARNHRTRVALGHHLSSAGEIAAAVDAGASLITHLGNGCPAMLPRHDNVILLQLANDRLMAGLITDGHHLPPDFIRVAIRCKGVGRLFVVSDQAPIAGFSPGDYQNLGNQVRLTPQGKIETVDSPYLAGSGATMAQCMRHLRSLELLDEQELWTVGLENPLRILGVDPARVETSDLPDFAW